MKFLPDAIVRKVASQRLLAAENSPTILFGAGVVGMVGSTILACRATLKLESVLDDIERDKGQAHIAKERVDNGNVPEGTTYDDSEFKRDLTIITVRGLAKVAKLYAPSVIVGGVSVVCLTKSHNILKDRNLALTAAYAAVDGAFKKYRERVVEKYGEEEDRDLYYSSQEVTIVDDETGEVVSTTRVGDDVEPGYARWYADWSSKNWDPTPEVNTIFLRQQQNWWNDKLRMRGHVFLNEVYESLGLSHTKAGAIVGWLWDSEEGDNFVDFGIFDHPTEPPINDFYNGREGSVLLDFNVDGPIYNKLREGL